MEPAIKKQPAIRFGDFELDQHAGELSKEGTRIRLQEQPLLRETLGDTAETPRFVENALREESGRKSNIKSALESRPPVSNRQERVLSAQSRPAGSGRIRR